MKNLAVEASAPKESIFLVDDHPLVREWLANLINRQPGLAVCGEAEGGAEALEAIAALKPKVAIVDITLKDSSGLQLIKELGRRCPGVAVLVLSMHEESHYAARAMQAGAKGYIMKRETSGNIIAAIRQVLRGETYAGPSLAGGRAALPSGAGRPLARPPAELLAHRELEVFALFGQGRSTRQVAETLGLSVKTVESHCAHIKQKLNLANAAELVREAVRWRESS
jgi:DNA-binding NarL/FixJ family response regulator